MPVRVDARDIVRLARQVGAAQRVLAAVRLAEVVRSATEAAAETIRRCLADRWPRSSISRKVRASVGGTRASLFGEVAVRHEWVEVLYLGANVPRHTIDSDRPMHLRVGKRGEVPKRWKIPGRTGPVVVWGPLRHPGYKGKDCMTPGLRTGERAMERGMLRIARDLETQIARGR